MHITMVKKTLADGSDCLKCAEATDHLQSKGLWHHIDEVVWAHEGDPASAGSRLGARLNVERAPFFVVRDEDGQETVYASVLQLVRDRLGRVVTDHEHAMAIDADDFGGI
jgi:hypothetical protein